jgi:hypothetical protein
MFFRSLARAGTLSSAFAAALLTLLTTAAHAAAPVWTGAPIQAQFVNNDVIINLKDQAVLRGGPPINVAVGTVFVDGQPSSTVNVTNAFQGGICLDIGDRGFDVDSTSVEVLLTATNGLREESQARVAIVLQNGGQVDPENSPQVQACFDPNSRPTANAGPDQTVNDGATVTLDGSASTDDLGAVLTYTWFDNTFDKALGSGTSPQLQVTLAPGAHDIELQVTDESGDGEIDTDFDNVQITVNNAVVPIANAGADRTIPDSDGEPGESVTLDGTASNDADGSIVSYEWSRRVDVETS